MRARDVALVLTASWLTAQEPGAVFRATVDLVQVDAIVTGSNGRPVSDLHPGDFDLEQDGKRQKITHFSYIETGAKAANTPESRRTQRLPSIPLKPEDTRRVIALVVDDLGIKRQDLATLRRSVDDFIEKQVDTADLVAVVQTGRGSGFPGQQFTNDKRVLRAAVLGLRSAASNRAEIDFEPRPRQAGSAESAQWRATEESNRAREEELSIATLEAVANVVKGMAGLPGRKALVLFSAGLPLSQPSQLLPLPSDLSASPVQSTKVRQSRNAAPEIHIEPLQEAHVTERTGARDALSRLIIVANGGGVAIYTIDSSLEPGGNVGLDVADQPDQVRRPDLLQSKAELSLRSRLDNQAGLQTVARDTGGIFMNPTDIDKALARVLTDEGGYYLLGYRPSPGTISAEPAKAVFHRISVRVKRKGLTVRNRSGFLGTAEEPAARPSTPEEILTDSLLSPFDSGGIGVRLTPVVRRKEGPVLQSLVYIAARDLQFTETATGNRTAAVDLALATLGEGGGPAGKIMRRIDIELTPAQYSAALEAGLVYNLAHEVKPGAYQWRVAIRDAVSGRTGSARQFVEVPDLVNGRLALGGLLIHEAPAGEDPRTGPAVREFRLGQNIDYEYEIFNPRHDDSGRMSVGIQARLFRDGNLVWTGASTSAVAATGSGRLEPAAMELGHYVLVLSAIDHLAGERHGAATQSIDFDVVKPAAAVPVASLPAEPSQPARSASASISPSESDPLLARIRERAADRIRQRPNYTCLETVERHILHDGCARCESSDRMRVEVALISGSERFAWPSSAGFEDKDLNELVRTGMVGSGDFAGASDIVLFSKFTTYTLRGEESVRGRRAIRYDYSVPVSARGYRLRGEKGEARVAFHGSFSVDAESLDLIRLEAIADDIPRPLRMSASSMAVHFSPVRIHDADFLLPSTTEVRVTRDNGQESVNTTRFSSCRQFTTESNLVQEVPNVETSGTAVQQGPMPPGLTVDTRLSAPITSADSAVGDPLRAFVVNDVKAGGKVVIPKGAVLFGRIKHLSEHRRPAGSIEAGTDEYPSMKIGETAPGFSTLVVEFTSFSLGDRHVATRVTLERFSGSVRSREGRMLPADSIISVKSPGPEDVILYFVPGLSVLQTGVWMRWKTVKAPS